MTDSSDTATLQEKADDTAYCTDFELDHETPMDSAFLWAFICPRCEGTNPLKGDPAGFKNRPFRCVECNWVSLLDAEAIEAEVGE
jgi:hypothetical protein